MSDTLKTTNANKKIDQISSNVSELEGIIKGNVSQLVSNIGNLDQV